MKTTVVSQTSGYIAPVLPIILCAPKFLDGSMTLGAGDAGGIRVHHRAGRLQLAGRQLSEAGRLDRVGPPRRLADGSLDGLSAPRAATASAASSSADDGEGAALRLQDLSVTLDDGTAVVDDTDITIMPGERVLIAGESGTGKSTLVRAIAGLWPWGGGMIEVQEGRQAVAAAAAALYPDRHAPPRSDLS